jgi:hypothetical protein
MLMLTYGDMLTYATYAGVLNDAGAAVLALLLTYADADVC